MSHRFQKIALSLTSIALLAACTPQPAAEMEAPTAKVAKRAATASLAGSRAPSEERTSAELPQFELKGVSARTWAALPGEQLCLESPSVGRTCTEVTQSTFAAHGSLYLGVQVEVKNLGRSEGMFTLGQLIADLSGKTYRYERVERSDEGQEMVQPLAMAIIVGTYEVPIDVLNEASFALDVGASDPITFSFDTPAAQEQERVASEASAAARNAQARAADQRDEQLYEKCWALNDPGSPMVSQEEFDWYVENCSHMYDVGSYETYLAKRIRRSG